MKAVAYIRVSGKSQVDGDGPDRQRQAIVEFCATHELNYAADLFEQGVSGTVEGLDRPKFAEALNLAASWGHAIIVERMDRLARDLMVQELILRECRERGVKVFATDQGLVDMASEGGDPSRVLIRQIMGAIAQWEKSVIVMKLRKARDRKRAETGRCEGPKPYGATGEERRVIDRILSLCDQGFSSVVIAQTLNREGHVRRGGLGWHGLAVYRVLKNQKGIHKCEAEDSITHQTKP